MGGKGGKGGGMFGGMMQSTAKVTPPSRSSPIIKITTITKVTTVFTTR